MQFLPLLTLSPLSGIALTLLFPTALSLPVPGGYEVSNDFGFRIMLTEHDVYAGWSYTRSSGHWPQERVQPWYAFFMATIQFWKSINISYLDQNLAYIKAFFDSRKFFYIDDFTYHLIYQTERTLLSNAES